MGTTRRKLPDTDPPIHQRDPAGNGRLLTLSESSCIGLNLRYNQGMASFNNMEKRMLRSIHRCRMFRGGDRVAVGVSGGKDSTFMLYMLARLREKVKGGFNLAAYKVIDEGSPCSAPENLDQFTDWCSRMDVPFHMIQLPPYHSDSHDPGTISPCFLCARRRRKALFERVHADGLTVLALGHSAFDLAVTALMNLTRHSALETMPPALDFFDGAIRVVRPIAMLTEAEIISGNRRIDAPLPPPSCPDTVGKTRADMEKFIRTLTRGNPHTVKNILRAAGRWDESCIGDRFMGRL